MRKLLGFMLAPLSWLLHSCSPLGEPVDFEISDNFYYDKSETDIIYSSMGNWFELGKAPLNADAESFDVLNAHLGKDKRQAYYKWHAIPSSEIDLKTFDASYADWMWHIGMDQYRVYSFGDDVIDGEWRLVMHVIEGADPNTFEQIDYQWAVDKDHRFYNHRMIPVDYESFEVINQTFAKDSDRVYLYSQDLFEQINADAVDFEKIDRYYARDANSIYFFLDYAKGKQIEVLKEIPYQVKSTIKVLEDNYLLVDDQVFYRGLLIEGANPKQLKVLSYDLAKDESNVYYQDARIAEADPETFRFDEEKYLYRDKYRLYTNEELTKRSSDYFDSFDEDTTSYSK